MCMLINALVPHITVRGHLMKIYKSRRYSNKSTSYHQINNRETRKREGHYVN